MMIGYLSVNHIVVEEAIIHSNTLLVESTVLLQVCQEQVERPSRLFIGSIQPPQLACESAYLLSERETSSLLYNSKEMFKREEDLPDTLSDMQSVMLRSTQSLSPVDRASAKRSLVMAFMTRLVN